MNEVISKDMDPARSGMGISQIAGRASFAARCHHLGVACCSSFPQPGI